MNTKNGKYFFIPDWLLNENSQTIHAYIHILNEINNNEGVYKTSYRNLSKELNVSPQNIRTIFKTITQQVTHKVTQSSTQRETLLSIDFIGVREDLKKPINTVTNTVINTVINTVNKAKQTQKKQTIQERKKAFIEDLKNHTEQYNKELLNDFFRYWAETDVKEQKMRFEYEKTWDLKLRLITWQKNDLKNFNKNQNTKTQEEKIGRTSIETIKKNAEYHGQY